MERLELVTFISEDGRNKHFDALFRSTSVVTRFLNNWEHTSTFKYDYYGELGRLEQESLLDNKAPILGHGRKSFEIVYDGLYKN